MKSKHKNIIAKKSLGQHFLNNEIILSDIANSASILPDDIVWEIGPGTGNLTDHILQKNVKPYCFEVDKDLWHLLKNKYQDNIFLIEKDILKVNWNEYISEQKIKVVANLPYQITSPFLFKVIDYHEHFELLVLMIQKEVALRIASKPNKKDYGVLSLKIQYYFNTEILFDVSPENFTPPPKVFSSVIRLSPRADKPVIDNLKLFWRIIETSFLNRRKMLRNNLKAFKYTIDYDQLCKNAPIDFARRGETLSESDYISLYNYLQQFIVC
ncbi:MAG TPA: 16S rRNA (adenine(1518)-N(6)/adenine(1519)-N(6))-dimethyltransferase RsmA [Candidatus Cloacimonadota bacterium]|nr:16S rRNA (adenine(1518)-N(6)/adenine(1519)-N(6))-dimethyltransferase RsmA [Candidatus Cloacimonadota bacterium]